jgi:Ca2+-binding RTX toxin-like protein
MGGGNDLVWGGGGNDTFVFAGSFGRDTIGDFRAGGGSEDVLEFDTELFVSFADVMAHAANLGGHTVITVDAATSITLQYVTVNNLHQDDFRFV